MQIRCALVRRRRPQRRSARGRSSPGQRPRDICQQARWPQPQAPIRFELKAAESLAALAAAPVRYAPAAGSAHLRTRLSGRLSDAKRQ